MKNNVRYLGSVSFYKHLILFTAACVFLLPLFGFFFLLAQYGKLKHNSENIVNEKQLHIVRLEAEIACYEEKLQERDTSAGSETTESEQIPETAGEEEKTEEDILLVPFEVDPEDVKYILVNDSHPLPESFQPDLVEIQNGQMVHKEIKSSLEDMMCDAEKEGFELIVCSAYRDYEKQAKLVEKSIDRYLKEGYCYTEAYWRAGDYLEMVGRSEHHTGLAVDLVGIAYQTLDEGQADTPESKWLNENSYKYGFIVRYPKDKEEATGVLYESWHFRYVGEQAAVFMRENQLCLEEFVELLYRQEGKQ